MDSMESIVVLCLGENELGQFKIFIFRYSKNMNIEIEYLTTHTHTHLFQSW